MSCHFLAACALTSTLAGSLLADEPKRPNVVVVLIDDLGRNDLGCYGSTFHRTPHLDRFAQSAVRFTDAYSSCPVCSPTRAALLTGKWPARLNLTDWLPGRPDRPDQKLLRPAIRMELPLEEVTLAEALRSAGYATGHVGKWHLGGAGFEPTKQGFDVAVAGDHTGTPLSYFAPFRDKQGRFMPGLETAPDGEYLTDRLTAEAERFLESNKDRPFFLYLAHYAVHTPLRAKADLVVKYKNDNKPGTQRNPTYAAMVESMDESVGRVLAKLDVLKLSERTVVVFTSDNGGLATLPPQPATSNAPLREGKGFLYEGGIRVPLIVRWPGVTKPGSDCAVPMSSLDLFPTLLEACGVRPPREVDGVSLSPALRGEPLDRGDLFWHYPHYHNQGGARPAGAIRSGRWKLIEYYENGRRELFDLESDLREATNRVAERPDLALQLGAKLEFWRKEVGARSMRPNPGYVPNPQRKDRSIVLPADTAEVHGLQLRYEPMPHKHTLGVWTQADDWASWEFQLQERGAFRVEILQGCAREAGGSAIEVVVAGQRLPATVKETGGWQEFEAREIGTVSIEKAGRYSLEVRAKTKRGLAVMDLRSVTLRPVKR